MAIYGWFIREKTCDFFHNSSVNKCGTPIAGWFIMENPNLEMDDN